MSRIVRALRLAVVPAQLAHELTHLAAAAPWLEEWAVDLGPDAPGSRYAVHANVREGTPALAVAWMHLAPALTGLLGALVAGLAMLVGLLSTTQSPAWLLLSSALACWWAVYTRPSRDDLAGAIQALEEADDGA